MSGTEQRRTADSTPAGEPRGGGFQAIGVAVAKLAAPIIGRRGGQLGRLKAAWPASCGGDWAGLTWPVSLGRDGALKLHVAPAAALALQHSAPLLIERINLFLGSTVVTRLTLLQALPPPPASAGAPPRPLTAVETAALEDALRRIADPELRAALAGLGRAVLGSQPPMPDIASHRGTG